MLPDILSLAPNVWVPLALALTVFVSFFVGHMTAPRRRVVVTREVEVETVPPELSRLAKALGITKDVPASQSYGRMIHDLFEAKDREKWALEQENAELSAEVFDLLSKLTQRRLDMAEEARAKSARIRAACTDTHDPAQTVGGFWSWTSLDNSGWTSGTFLTDDIS